jgi:hypothetical protein
MKILSQFATIFWPQKGTKKHKSWKFYLRLFRLFVATAFFFVGYGFVASGIVRARN